LEGNKETEQNRLSKWASRGRQNRARGRLLRVQEQLTWSGRVRVRLERV